MDILKSIINSSTIHNVEVKGSTMASVESLSQINRNIPIRVIRFDISSVDGLLIYLTSELSQSEVEITKLMIYETILDIYIHTKITLGNIDNFLNDVTAYAIDIIGSNKVYFSNVYVALLKQFYILHDEQLNINDYADGMIVIYCGMVANCIANIIIV